MFCFLCSVHIHLFRYNLSLIYDFVNMKFTVNKYTYTYIKMQMLCLGNPWLQVQILHM